MKKYFLLLCTGVCVVLKSTWSAEAINLVSDASFESAAPAWFSEEGKGAYFAAKEKVENAAEGKKVVVVQGWVQGAKILSPVFDLSGDVFSATMKVRSFGSVNGGSVSLVLFDENGAQPLTSFGSIAFDGKKEWKTMDSKGVKLSQPATKGRLGLVMEGSQKGVRVEIDQVGLFAGTELDSAADNSDFLHFEAESMANGKAWKEMGHFPNWYMELPNEMKMLTGHDGAATTDELSVSHPLSVRFSGKYRLWTRLYLTDHSNHADYTIHVEQDGKEVATEAINDGDPKLGPAHTWVWVPLDVTLSKGEAKLVVTRPPGASSWISRKIDMFLLTNDLSYQPRMADVRPKCYVRFTNETEGGLPLTLSLFLRRLQGPVYYMEPGMLSAGGMGNIGDADRYLAKGESSPWVFLSPYIQVGGNNMAWTAHRPDGLVKGEWKGKLEFAIGDEHQIIKTIPLNQDLPQMLMTMDALVTRDGKDIKTGFEYVAQGEEALAKAVAAKGKVATHLDIFTGFSLVPGVNDSALVDRETALLHSMGFNGTYTPLTDGPDILECQTKHQLPHMGLWGTGALAKGVEPDTERLKTGFQMHATKFASILDKVQRMKLDDESSGPTYEQITTIPECKPQFVEYLKSLGVTPAQLKVSSWEEVAPVGPDKQKEKPELFYYSGLYRLWMFADFWRKVVAIKKQYLPDNIKTYTNYSPPHGDQQTWDARGNDLFMAQRNGGFEMGWSEDWLGYGASPEQMSNVYGLLRSAGSPTQETLGGYIVAVSGSTALQRLKYYTMIAAGVRHVNVYNYGPIYASIDSWSGNLDVYPMISAVQHELGVIDEALYGTHRRKTEVAMLYNRTAGIWGGNINATEEDANITLWALGHAGYDVDYLPEEDIDAGKLEGYKVLYINGIQIQPKTAQKIAQWVEKGGVLCGDAGAGTRDQFNRPLDTLDKVFGVRSGELKLEANAGRPKYELRMLAPIDVALTAEGAKCPEVKFERLCIREKVEPLSGTQVILKTTGDEAVGFIHPFGKGKAIRFAVLPGIAYLHDAVKVPGYDIETYLPQAYNPNLRDFIAWPAQLAGASPMTVCNADIARISRYDGERKDGQPERSVIFAVDYSGQPRPDFKMVVPDASKFTKAYTGQGAEVKVKPLAEGKLEVAFPLNVADAVVLEK